MVEKIAITDITRMARNFICVAGVRRDGSSVRPLLRNGRFCDDWFCVDGHYIKPFSVVELDFQEPRPLPPHTEDIYIDANHLLYISDLTMEKRKTLIKKMDDGSLANIFGAPLHKEKFQKASFVKTGTGDRSLGLIRPNIITKFIYKQMPSCWDFRLSFTDQTETEYRIKIVDLSFQTFVDYKRICQNLSCEQIQTFILDQIFNQPEVFLRIGLARGWANYPDRCYLQITGVYTFPDYLHDTSFQVLQHAIAAQEDEHISF